MKKTRIGTKYTVGILAALFILLSGRVQVCFGEGCPDNKIVDCSSYSGGCTKGAWSVLCDNDETGCHANTCSRCYEVTSTSSYCGDCLVYEQGCGTKSGTQTTLTLGVTGTYGTPSCNANCDESGECINKTPYPSGKTFDYYIIDQEPC